MSLNLQNSIWPNTDGNLGNIKVQIPTGTASDPWPIGDALVNNYVFHNGKLVGFVDTKALIANSSKTTTFPYEYVNISLPSIAEGEMTYNHDQCAYFILNGEVIKGDVPSDEELEEITKKYAGCKTVADVKAIDPDYKTNDIVDGVWSEGLGDLENGSSMFMDCSNLTTFTGDLNSLIYGDAMFASSQLKIFNCDMPRLVEAHQMYYFSALASFVGDLSSLTNGWYMFNYCGIEHFESNLSSLTNGYYMFKDGKLDTDSIKNVAETINDVRSLTNGTADWHDVYKVLHLGISNVSPTDEENTYFEQIQEKGWTVYVNGSEYTTSSGSSGYYNLAANAVVTSLDETDGEVVTPKPYWAKPVPSDEEHAQYVDAEGNFFNILGAQFIYGDDISTYGMFTCEEDAAANMRLTKIEK